ncbi:50S ribosomal protein L23 [Mycoplasmopsis opalescens]|uniref:50S ribosomal protein L23 n=1 Tax=Mycoplasmopsis opalescens TaxID=114886 RepID=UPI0004A6FB57|nr:50S ribosomal protein L23 [Mycoplasmopsis opalescens]
MEITQVIRRPILTEKSSRLQENNSYTFEVDYNANKFQIKQAVEFIFNVKVESVNTIKGDKKAKRVGRFNGFTNRVKKAIVTLKDGFVINYYPQEQEKQDKVAEKAKAEEKAVAAEKEAKLAEKIAAKKAAKSTKASVDKQEKEKTDKKAPTKKPRAKKEASK